MTQSMWMTHFFAPEVYKSHQMKLLSGASQTNLATFVEFMLSGVTRWVTTQPAGGWRYIPYKGTVGTSNGNNNTSLGQANTWQDTRAVSNADLPASISGPWKTQDWGADIDYGSPLWVTEAAPGFMYVSPFWTSMDAAVEWGTADASAVWDKIVGTSGFGTGDVTNLSTWFNYPSTTDARHLCYPRNK